MRTARRSAEATRTATDSSVVRIRRRPTSHWYPTRRYRVWSTCSTRVRANGMADSHLSRYFINERALRYMLEFSYGSSPLVHTGTCFLQDSLVYCLNKRLRPRGARNGASDISYFPRASAI